DRPNWRLLGFLRASPMGLLFGSRGSVKTGLRVESRGPRSPPASAPSRSHRSPYGRTTGRWGGGDGGGSLGPWRGARSGGGWSSVGSVGLGGARRERGHRERPDGFDELFEVSPPRLRRCLIPDALPRALVVGGRADLFVVEVVRPGLIGGGGRWHRYADSRGVVARHRRPL